MNGSRRERKDIAENAETTIDTLNRYPALRALRVLRELCVKRKFVVACSLLATRCSLLVSFASFAYFACPLCTLRETSLEGLQAEQALKGDC